MIRDVWKLNVSTVLILPLFNDITKNLKIDKKPVSFTQLCFLYNIKSCYLDPSLEKLIFVFFREDCSKKLYNTNISGWSLSELLVTRNNYEKFEIYNDYMIFYYNIDSIYHKDIGIIYDSKYSSVSNKFTDQVNVKNHFNRLYRTNTLGDYLTTKNIALSIYRKEEYMKELIEDYLGIILPIDNEYFKKFEVTNEIFTQKLLC